MNTGISVIEMGKTTDLKIKKNTVSLFFFDLVVFWAPFWQATSSEGREDRHLFRRGCPSILVLILPTLEGSLSILIRESGCTP